MGKLKVLNQDLAKRSAEAFDAAYGLFGRSGLNSLKDSSVVEP